MIFEFITHKDISGNALNRICMLKQQHWHYSIQEQLKWIEKNLRYNDIHVLLNDSGRGGLLHI
jgi:hypothetical protein